MPFFSGSLINIYRTDFAGLFRMGQKKITVRLDEELYQEVLRIMNVYYNGIKKQAYFAMMLENWINRFRK